MKTIITTILIILAISAGTFALRTVLLPARVAERTLSTTEGIIDDTLTADNAIYNYEWFKRQYEQIEAMEDKIIIAQSSVDEFEVVAGERENWTFEDKTEHARLRSVEQGLRSQYEDMVAEYNARSEMANRNIFKDGLIPNTIKIGSSFLR